MALLIREAVACYRWYIYEEADQRTREWPLSGNPMSILGILAFYMWFVQKGGPAFMKNRQPFQLDTIIQIYNFFQVVVCGSLGIYGFLYFYGPGGAYNWFCDEIDYGYGDHAIAAIKLAYSYFLLKVVDLLDTVFFVLRKKSKQITFLHVYHHVIMVMGIWWGFKFVPGGHVMFLAIINCCVHSVMYFYYFLSNWNREYRNSLWWKKYITILQILQFLLIITHNMVMFAQPNCGFPKTPIMVFMPQNLLILFMFMDFYRKTYLMKPKKQNVS